MLFCLLPYSVVCFSQIHSHGKYEMTRIIAGIWPASLYQATENCLTTSESASRVPPFFVHPREERDWSERCDVRGLRVQHQRDKSPDGQVSLGSVPEARDYTCPCGLFVFVLCREE